MQASNSLNGSFRANEGEYSKLASCNVLQNIEINLEIFRRLPSKIFVQYNYFPRAWETFDLLLKNSTHPLKIVQFQDLYSSPGVLDPTCQFLLLTSFTAKTV